MNAKIQQLLDDALDLPAEDRVHLADLLLETVNPAHDERTSPEWDAEIARRIQELDNGTAKTIPWEEVRRKLDERIRNYVAD